MAQHEIGNPDEDRTALSAAADLLAKTDASHHDWQIADILRTEAEALINGTNHEP